MSTRLIGGAEKQLKSWNLTVYGYFKPPTIIKEDGKVTYVFICKIYISFPALCFSPLTNSAIVDHLQLKSLVFAMTTAQAI